MSAACDERTKRNKMRTLAKQVRRFPEDLQAESLFIERYGYDAIRPLKPYGRAKRRTARRAALAKAGA